MWKFPGRGLNLRHRSDSSCCNDNTRSFTRGTTKPLCVTFKASQKVLRTALPLRPHGAMTSAGISARPPISGGPLASQSLRFLISNSRCTWRFGGSSLILGEVETEALRGDNGFWVPAGWGLPCTSACSLGTCGGLSSSAPSYKGGGAAVATERGDRISGISDSRRDSGQEGETTRPRETKQDRLGGSN